MTAHLRADAPPRLWLLSSGRAGDDAETAALAGALGWPAETKTLRYTALRRAPNLLLGAALASLDRARSSPLAPPWPDLVITRGWHSVPVARWIRRASGGRTRLVVLGQPRAPLGHFDLVITTPQYRLPARPNLVVNRLPLVRPDPARLAEARARWAERLNHLPRPYLAVLVGGDSRPYVLDPATAIRLGQTASAAAAAAGGSLLVSTSPRTSPAAAEALFAAIDAPAYRHRWQADAGDNPYPAFLALADAFLVTGDSSAMLAEACAGGKPVSIFALPRRADWRLRATWAFWAWATRGGQASWRRQLLERLVESGLITATGRDTAGYHAALEADGLIVPLGATLVARRPRPDDLARSLTRIRALVADRANVAEEPQAPAPAAARR